MIRIDFVEACKFVERKNAKLQSTERKRNEKESSGARKTS